MKIKLYIKAIITMLFFSVWSIRAQEINIGYSDLFVFDSRIESPEISESTLAKIDSLAFIRALKQFVTNNKGITSAAIRDSVDIQRIVLIDKDGDLHRNDLIDRKDFRATSVENLALIGILRTAKVYAGMRNYQIGLNRGPVRDGKQPNRPAPPIERYYIHEYLSIYEARTGKLIYSRKFDAAEVSFPHTAPLGQTTIIGRVDHRQIKDFISSLFTLPLPVFKWEALRDPDGNVYNTVIIGTQEWTVENWHSTKYTDGTAIPNVERRWQWRRLSSGAYCWYDNDPKSLSNYGAFYNWYTVETGKLCPEGWRVPTDDDWSLLTDYIIAIDGNIGLSFEGEGIRKYLASQNGWIPINMPHVVDNNSRNNNRSGFSALPGGNRWSNGRFYSVGYHGYWWSATEDSGNSAWSRGMNSRDGTVNRSHNNKTHGFSIRCMRDLD